MTLVPHYQHYFYVHTVQFCCLLFICTKNAYIYKYIIILQIASTSFGASAPSSGSFDIAFAKVMKYNI